MNRIGKLVRYLPMGVSIILIKSNMFFNVPFSNFSTYPITKQRTKIQSKQTFSPSLYLSPPPNTHHTQNTHVTRQQQSTNRQTYRKKKYSQSSPGASPHVQKTKTKQTTPPPHTHTTKQQQQQQTNKLLTKHPHSQPTRRTKRTYKAPPQPSYT